jgi:hypothetical protein
MAKAATKTTKPAAAKKLVAKLVTAAANTTAKKSAAKSSGPATATIKFDKVQHGGVVRGAVNGQKFEFPVDKEVQVTAAQLAVLNDSHAKYETISPLAGEDADEGSSASSTIGGTATRMEPANSGTQVDAEGNLVDPPELRQVTDEELKSGSQEANADQAKAAENA